MAIDLGGIENRLNSLNWMLHLTTSRDDMAALINEVKRLRAELTTTLVACEQCGCGVPPKWMVHDLCPACAACQLTGYRVAWQEEHDERIRQEERIKKLSHDAYYWQDKADYWRRVAQEND